MGDKIQQKIIVNYNYFSLVRFYQQNLFFCYLLSKLPQQLFSYSCSFLLFYCPLILSTNFTVVEVADFIFRFNILNVFFLTQLRNMFSQPYNVSFSHPPPSVIIVQDTSWLKPPAQGNVHYSMLYLFPCENNLLGLVEPISWSRRGGK